jgi:hypothetical protein
VNELRVNELKMSNQDLNQKLLHNLPADWKHNVTVIKKTTDIIDRDLPDVIAEIEELEIDESTRNLGTPISVEPYKCGGQKAATNQAFMATSE